MFDSGILFANRIFIRVVQRERNGARESRVSQGKSHCIPAELVKGDRTCLVITRLKTSSEKRRMRF